MNDVSIKSPTSYRVVYFESELEAIAYAQYCMKLYTNVTVRVNGRLI